MTVRMRINRSATRSRRSHHALKGVRLSACASCGAMHIPHRACMTCGKYNGRVVVDVVKAVEKKAAKAKAKNAEAAKAK